MRRNARRRADKQKIWEDKRVISGSIIAIAVAIVAGFASYSNTFKNTELDNANPNQIISLEPGDEIDNSESESASSSIGNTVKQSEEKNANTSDNVTRSQITDNTTSTKQNTINSNESKVTNSNKNTKVEEDTTPTSSNAKKEEKTSFNWPIKGDILKAFSTDNLLFSSTLQEWITHNGIDIKADKASVVEAAADGTVKSIKNDPRYGLTVTIEHTNGFKTVYSNLLTAEFVVEGEKIKQGQSIGTVGNTANFEIADGFHLHFEILKDSEYVDPMIYLK